LTQILKGFGVVMNVEYGGMKKMILSYMISLD